MIIGITGQSGCGKTTVSGFLKEKGFFIIDCDKIAHDLMENELNMLAELKNEFGDEYFNGNVLNRRKLGSLVFNNSEKLLLLNKITHKYIHEKVLELVKNNQEVVIDAPLLFESGLDKICDKCIYVYCPEEIRIERIMKRDGISKEYAVSRIKSQKDDEFYRNNCHFTVINDGKTEISEQLKELFN